MACCVTNCKNLKNANPNVLLFPIPPVLKQTKELWDLSTKRQNAWLVAIKVDFRNTSLQRIRVCSDHFRKGRPASLRDNLNPDWVPNLKLGQEDIISKNCDSSSKRHDPLVNTQTQTVIQNDSVEDYDGSDYDENSSMSSQDPFATSENDISSVEEDDEDDGENENNGNPLDLSEHESNIESEDVLNEPEFIAIDKCSGDQLITNNQVNDLDQAHISFESMQEKLKVSEETIKKYEKEKQQAEEREKKLKQLVYSYAAKIKEQDSLIDDLSMKARFRDTGIEGMRYDNDKVEFFTGLSSFKILSRLYDLVKNDVETLLKEDISGFDSFILTLMKFKFDHSFTYFTYKYVIPEKDISSVYYRNINIFYDKICTCVKFPDKSSWILKTPSCFKKSMANKCVVLIHFLETETETMCEKKRNQCPTKTITIKYLIAFSPYGSIMYVSKGYNGEFSNEYIIAHCGFLDFIQKDYVVLSVHKMLKFDSEKQGDEDMDVGTAAVKEVSSTIATTVINLLRERYKIICNRQKLPSRTFNNNLLEYDKVVKCCCALINLNPPEFDFIQPKQNVSVNKRIKLS